MERSEAAGTRSRDENRTGFERFVETAHHRVSTAPFFFLCLGIIVAWFASAPLWPNLKEWQVAIHTFGSVLSLLLLILLENAGRCEVPPRPRRHQL